MFLFLYYVLFPFVYSQQFCKAPCNECPSSHYYNKGIQVKDIIDFEIDCSLKPSSELFYAKDFYLSNKPCNDFSSPSPSSCMGDPDNPMDDFWSVIKKIYEVDEAHKFQSQDIRIFLLGNIHFIIYDETLFSRLESPSLKLFKDFNNGSIQILPAICDKEKLLDNCFNDSIDFMDIYIKIDLFQFFISFKFLIENVRFWGNDLANINYKNDTCLRQKIICCFSSNNYCNMSKNLIINDENLDKKSMFLLKSKNEFETPQLFLTNVHFLNFYAIKEEIGWRSLIYCENTLKKIQLVNFTILNFFFSHGLLYDKDSLTTIYQVIDNITIKNAYIGNYSSILYRFNSNSSLIKIGLFSFKNSSFLALNISNLTISYFNILPLNPTHHVFLFEFVFYSQLRVLGLNFENNIDLSFCYVDSSLNLYIKGFSFSNVIYSKNSSFFALVNGSNTIFENGSFLLISNFKSSFFYCQNNSELSLNYIQIIYFYGIFGNCSNSIISFYDAKFETFKADYFMLLLKSNLTINNLNFSSSIFIQAAFYISDVRNLIYNKSWCITITTPSFFFFQSNYFDVRAKIFFYFIRIMNTTSNLIFFNIDGASLDFVSFRDVEMLNCSNLFLINVKASFNTITLINISIINMIYSAFYVAYIEQNDQLNFLSPNVFFVNLTNIFIQNCLYQNTLFLFHTPNKDINLEIKEFAANYSYCQIIFYLGSLSTTYKNYQAKFNNITLINMKGSIKNPGINYFVYLTASIDSISITNFIAANCNSIQILHLITSFNLINLFNISISFIAQNNYFLMTVMYRNNYNNLSKMNSVLSIQNMNIKSTKISKSVNYVFVLKTINAPILLKFSKCYIENLQASSIFYFESLVFKLFSVEISNLEFYNVKSFTKWLFFLNFATAPISFGSISNIYIHDSDTFILISLPHMFENIILKNITIINIHYNWFYVIGISQKESRSTNYTKVEMENILFLDVEINNDFGSPMSSLAFTGFDELIMQNIFIKNMRNYKLEMQRIACFGNLGVFRIVIMKNIYFEQNVWCNLYQVFILKSILYLEVNNFRFNISWNSLPSIKRFQGLYIINSNNITFRNNEFHGLSTIERPQYKSEEIGVVAFMAEESYNFPLSGNYSLIIENNVFNFNYGIRYGIMGLVGFTQIVLRNNTFINNEAYYGGAIAIISVKNITFEGLTIINSKAQRGGGGIYFLNTNKIYIWDSYFYNSSSEFNGGCLYAREVIEIFFKNVSVHKSSTRDNGGTAYFISIQNLNFDNFFIHNSSASLGGMFFFDEKTNVLIDNSHFKKGFSFLSGGFAFIQGDDMNITICNTSFFDFFSEQDAAIIFSSNIWNFTIAHSSISSSIIKNNGLGIIFLNGYSEGKEKLFNFFNISFFNNSASHGSNIYYTSNSKLNLLSINSSLNQGSLFNFESESNSLGNVVIQSSSFTLTNYLSSEWSQHSLIFLSNCFIMMQNIRIINNNGTKHLFELVLQANLFLNNSIIINYSSIKSTSSFPATSKSKIFNILNSRLTSDNNTIDYSIKWDTSFQCIYFEIRESKFISINDSYQNFSSADNEFLFTGFISSIDITNISLRIFTSLKSTFFIKESNFSLNNIFINFTFLLDDHKIGFLFNFDGVDSNKNKNFINITNCFFSQTILSIFFISNIYKFVIDNCIFEALDYERLSRAIEAINVNIFLVNRSIFQNYFHDKGSCILMISTSNTNNILLNITNTVFLKNQAYFSSAIYIRGNISLAITDCFFKENKAIIPILSSEKNNGKGACMIIDCEYYKGCSAIITTTKFENNYAQSVGPTILSKVLSNITMVNLTFINNNDKIKFTNAVSAFPLLNFILNQSFEEQEMENSYNLISENSQRTKQIISKYELTGNLTIASGQIFNLSVLVTDALMQQVITNFDIKTTLTCTPFSNLQNDFGLMINRGFAPLNKGFIFFEQVSITFKPFSLLKCEINYQYPQDMLFDSMNPSNSKLNRYAMINLNVFVRECIIGEIYQIDETCYPCPFGTYALFDPNKMDLTKKCLLCPANAYCDGGKNLSPLKGYWRLNNQTNLILKCLNEEACLGVGDSVANTKKYNLFYNLTELQKIQGICGSGYEGNLCYNCKKGLARYKNKGPCQECDCPQIIYFKIGLSLLFIIFYVSSQIKIFSNFENKDPHLALLVKILLNHFQTIFMMDLIDFGWAYDFNFYLSIKDYLSFLSEDFFVIDCLIQKINGNLLVNKIIFAILLPLISSLIFFFLWIFSFLFVFFKKKSRDFLVEKIRITLLIFLFIFYPEILKKAFSLMNCVLIDEIKNIKVLAHSPNVECWTPQHTFWVLTISLPGIFLWGILAPTFICIIIKIYYKNINKMLHEKEYNSLMRILESEKNHKFIIFKSTIINIEKDLASKIFAIQKPTLDMKIGYITKRQTFIEKKRIIIVEKEELEGKINSVQTEKNFPIILPSFPGKQSKKMDEIFMCQNTTKVIKKPEDLLKVLETDCVEDLKVTKEDLNLNKVLIQVKYEIEYNYKRKIETKNVIPSKMLNFNISPQALIIMRNFGFIYSGYRKEYLFWELVMFSRKFIFIFIGVTTEAFPNSIKSLLFIAFLSFYIFLQLTYIPYKFDSLNRMEFFSLITALLTSLIGLILFSPQFEQISILFVIIVLGTNIIFLVFWGKMAHRYGKLEEKLLRKIVAIKK